MGARCAPGDRFRYTVLAIGTEACPARSADGSRTVCSRSIWSANTATTRSLTGVESASHIVAVWPRRQVPAGTATVPVPVRSARLPATTGRRRTRAMPGPLTYWPVQSSGSPERSEEHTSELQSRPHLVCRLLLEKKKRHPKHLLLTQQKKKQK